MTPRPQAERVVFTPAHRARMADLGFVEGEGNRVSWLLAFAERAVRDLAEARRDAVDLVIDRRLLAGATPLGDETCTECGAPMGWGLPHWVGASGTMRCTRCSVTGRRIFRIEDGTVVILPDGVETYAGDLARRLRAGGGR